MIGIDARKIRDGGIGRALEGLLGELARLEGPERYVLFLRPDEEHPLPRRLDADRFRLEPCDAGLYSLREVFAFRGAAKRLGLDLLHLPHYVRPWRPGCPVSVTIHDAIHLSHPPSLAAAVYARAMMTWSARTAAVLFTPTEWARRDVAARTGIDAARIRVAPNGVDTRFVPPGPEAVARFRAGRGLARDYVLCVGSHRPHKNVAAAVAAFAEASPAGAEFVLTAADDRAARAMDRFVRPGVRLLARVPDDDMPALYAGARLVLAPSLAEGFGLGPLEACACGAPVVATAIPPHREVLGDAVEWIPASGRRDAIRNALVRLWEDDARLADLARRGPARARGFGWDRAAAATRAGWRAALGGAPRSAGPLV